MSILNVNSNCSLNLQIEESKLDSFCGCVTASLFHIYDWYDQIESYRAELLMENKVGELKFEKELTRGMYILQSIYTEAREEIIDYNNKSLSYNYCFVIGSAKDLDKNNYKDAYSKILTRRELEFEKPKGNIEEGNEIYDSYIFVKNINPLTTIQYGDLEIVPFNEYRALSEASMIDAFFQKDDSGFDYSSEIEGHYGAVICMKNIYSKNGYKDAAEYSQKRAEILVNLYSLHNRDNAQIIAAVMKNVTTGLFWISNNGKKDVYKGNLLRLGDWGYTIRKQYQYLSGESSNISAFLKMLNEAIIEKDRMASYYKYWCILEVFAECEGVEGSDVKYWNGMPFLDKKGNTPKVEKAVDAVFELLRKRFSSEMSEYYFSMGNTPVKVKEFLIVVHQRRNCYAHRGECKKNDLTVCDQSSPNKTMCRNNMDEVSDKYSDSIINQLENIVVRLLLSEIDKVIGKAETTSDYILDLLE